MYEINKTTIVKVAELLDLQEIRDAVQAILSTIDSAGELKNKIVEKLRLATRDLCLALMYLSAEATIILEKTRDLSRQAIERLLNDQRRDDIQVAQTNFRKRVQEAHKLLVAHKLAKAIEPEPIAKAA
jgi:hypothetical protein